MQIRKYFEQNDDKNTTCQYLGNVATSCILRET